MFKKHCLDFNAINNQKSIHIGGCPHQLSRDSPSYKNTLVGAKLEVFFILKSSGRGNFWCQKLHKNATPLIVTAVLNSTRAALTRATHSDRRPLDTVSLSTACSNLRMGCPCYYYQINNCTVPLRLQEGFSTLV